MTKNFNITFFHLHNPLESLYWQLNDLCVFQLLQLMGGLPDEYKQIVIDTISIRREDVRLVLKTETNAISDSVLTDFDWQIKVDYLQIYKYLKMHVYKE